jgi:hypothetical protein
MGSAIFMAEVVVGRIEKGKSSENLGALIIHVLANQTGGLLVLK